MVIQKHLFVVVDILKKNLLIKGDYSTIEDYDILPKNLIQYNKRGLSLEFGQNLKILQEKNSF